MRSREGDGGFDQPGFQIFLNRLLAEKTGSIWDNILAAAQYFGSHFEIVFRFLTSHASAASYMTLPFSRISRRKKSPQLSRLATSEGVRTNKSNGKSRCMPCRMRTDIRSPRS